MTSTFSVQPINSRIIVRRAPEKERDFNAPSIEVPEQLRERPNEGEVLSVAEGSLLKVGETVMFGKFAGVEIEVQGESLLLLREEEVIARVLRPAVEEARPPDAEDDEAADEY